MTVDGAENTADGPMTRQEGEETYRKLKGALIFSMMWSFVIAGLVIYFGERRWYTYPIAAAIVVSQLVGTPLWLRYFRRSVDERVREGEAALGKGTLFGG
jgi:hypothetical protein